MTLPTLDDGSAYRICVRCGTCQTWERQPRSEDVPDLARLADEFALTEEGSRPGSPDELLDASNRLKKQRLGQVREALVVMHGEEAVARWWDSEALLADPEGAMRDLGDDALSLMLSLHGLHDPYDAGDREADFDFPDGYVFTEAGGDWQLLNGEWICIACQTPALEREAAAEWVARLRRQARYVQRTGVELSPGFARELAAIFYYGWVIEQRLLRWTERAP